jgi:uncharacterized glyoxalase superfamily protein PhnB
MKISVYLTFDGNCAEAFDFYKAIFGAKLSFNSTFVKEKIGTVETF